MRKKNSKRKNELPVSTKNIIGIIISSVIGFIAIVIITLVASMILTKSSALSDSTTICFVVSVAIGSLFTGFIASKKCELKGIISGLIASVPLLIMLTIMMLLFSQGRLIPESLILYIGIVIFSAIGGIVSANTKRRK